MRRGEVHNDDSFDMVDVAMASIGYTVNVRSHSRDAHTSKTMGIR